MGDELTNFLRGKRERASSEAVDRREERENWAGAVKRLYGVLTELLGGSIGSGDVTLRQFDMEVAEDPAGIYLLPALELNAGTERVEFRPVSATAAQKEPAVEIRGARGEIALVKDAAGVDRWSVIFARIPKLKVQPLDQESLALALERVMLP